jgi:hypothetical protein
VRPARSHTASASTAMCGRRGVTRRALPPFVAAASSR